MSSIFVNFSRLALRSVYRQCNLSSATIRTRLPSLMGLFTSKNEYSSDSASDPDRAADEVKWREKLTPEQFHVCRQKGTEPPFSGAYLYNKEKGIYTCAGCGAPLFESKTKFDSGSGWPSFYQVYKSKEGGVSNVLEKVDTTHGMVRTEVLCAKCGCHLGHVFPDGPKPTGLRYCINSVSLNFAKEKTDSADSKD